ncbi:hypothetical protein J6590_051012 [Homalodisca vitripennis]|nr:hypothetical protein J6590_051012 [Homalodisca vitripennis]
MLLESLSVPALGKFLEHSANGSLTNPSHIGTVFHQLYLLPQHSKDFDRRCFAKSHCIAVLGSFCLFSCLTSIEVQSRPALHRRVPRHTLCS